MTKFKISVLKSITIAFIGLSIVVLTSCQNDDLIKNTEALSLEQEEQYLSEDSDGNSSEIKYTYGPVVRIKDNFSKDSNFSIGKGLFSRNSVTTDWQKINMDHLKKLSKNAHISFTNGNDLLHRFTRVLDKGTTTPKNVCINDYKFGNGGQNPNKKYDWHAEFRTKAYIYKGDPGASYTPYKRVQGTASRSERNRSGKRKWMSLPGQWRIETTNQKNWNVTGSISTEVGGKIGVPLVTEGSIKVTVGLQAGGGGSYSKKITEVVEGGGIWVPDGKVANWELVERHKNYKTKWKTPLEFKGYVGSDYGKKHHGHYFWAVSASGIFHEYTGYYGIQKEYIIDVNEEYEKNLRIRAWITDN
ncbi:hypothetical protein [Aquimarina sp. AU58]|uniref:hypothetical protein n=1 Tax=Aquimarina sp. AU58 TaxID=1874112 RepID=UPI000D64AC87|nr:hypothetical protein [Aquimarina sp. AU58]